MKHTLCLLLFLIGYLSNLCAKNENDSLLTALDKVISQRRTYTEKKENTIKTLKLQKAEQKTLEDLYRLNSQIIYQYETFVCDSAERYINENIEIARKLNNQVFLLEGQLKLAFVYSLSGLFVQATDILKSIRCETLPDYLKALYCWNSIRYYENLIKYTADTKFSKEYQIKKELYRDTVMSVLYKQSDEYLKEEAFKLQSEGQYAEPVRILIGIYNKQKTDTHAYAMAAMGVARA
ncbi:MAG TPA: hypothetical protein K8W04_02315, partial [Bacteroides reticulotermitis]|nr:hypothetical protein [Bacteroides reticulotermitis]